MQPIVQRICVYPLQIPLRTRVSHATSERDTADPIIVAVEFLGGTIGYGETLPRPYVTGETVLHFDTADPFCYGLAPDGRRLTKSRQ